MQRWAIMNVYLWRLEQAVCPPYVVWDSDQLGRSARVLRLLLHTKTTSYNLLSTTRMARGAH